MAKGLNAENYSLCKMSSLFVWDGLLGFVPNKDRAS